MASVMTVTVLKVSLLILLIFEQKYYRTSVLFVLRSISKHSPELAESLEKTVGLQYVIECLEHFDPSVKEAAAWVIGNIAGHSADLARTVEKAGDVYHSDIYPSTLSFIHPLFTYCTFKPRCNKNFFILTYQAVFMFTDFNSEKNKET